MTMSASLVARIFALISLIAPAVQAHGGHIVGNGGDVVVCPEQKTVEVLDLFEGRLEGFKPSLGDESLSVDAKIEVALLRLARVDAERAQVYRTEVQRFWRELSEVRGVTLENIPDSHHILIPAGCHVEQIAVQDAPQPNPYRAYILNRDLWDALDTTHQAALVLHEVVYHEALQYGHLDSRLARRFNFTLLSDAFQQISLADYQQLLTLVSFPRFAGVDFTRFLTKREVDDWPTGGRKSATSTTCRPQPMLPDSRSDQVAAGALVQANRERNPYYFIDPLHIPWMFVAIPGLPPCFIKASRESFLWE